MASVKPSDKVTDMLRRIKATGLSDQDVHERARLSSGWLTQARQGRYGPTAPSVKKLERWLKRFEAGKAEDAPEETVSDAEAELGEDATVARRISVGISGGAKTHAEVAVLERRLAAAILVGDVDEGRGELALRALKDLKRSITLEREESNLSALRALDILTPDEETHLAEFRAKRAGPPVQPGAYVPPPAADMAKAAAP